MQQPLLRARSLAGAAACSDADADAQTCLPLCAWLRTYSDSSNAAALCGLLPLHIKVRHPCHCAEGTLGAETVHAVCTSSELRCSHCCWAHEHSVRAMTVAESWLQATGAAGLQKQEAART